MTPNLVWIVDHLEISPIALKLLRDHGYVTLNNPIPADYPNIIGIFIRTYTKLDGSLVHQLPNLQFVLKAGVGLDNLDLPLLRRLGIAVYNAPGSNAKAVAEYVISSAIYTLRKINIQSKQIRSGNWRSYQHIGLELSSKVFGLIGFGAVGRELAKRLIPFEVQIVTYDPHINPNLAQQTGVELVSLDELLSRSDIISIQVPLTVETKDMIDQEKLSLAKDGAILINVSRGEIIRESALLQFSREGKFGGLVLDVFANEPYINPSFLTLPNTILTPHIAGFTIESNERMSTEAVNNLIKSTSINSI